MAALSSEDARLAESARARLLVLGPRAVGALIAELASRDGRIRQQVIALLALIRDPRACVPLQEQLIDPDPRIREASARALAVLPCAESIPELERTLRGDDTLDVRIASLQSLLALFEAGYEGAIRDVLSVALDRGADRRLRHASLAIVPLLKRREARSLLERLAADPDPEVVRWAGYITQAPERPPGSDGQDLSRAIADLASPRPERWNDAVRRLTQFGSAVIDPLVHEMVERGHDPGYCARAGIVLRGLGARRLRPIVSCLDRVEEPVPLEVIVEVFGVLEDKPLIYRLKDLLDRLRLRRAAGQDTGERAEGFERVRAKAHLQLARIGSRVAVDDLKEALAAPGRRLPLELLTAVELIGKRDELFDLLRTWQSEESWTREKIRAVFQKVMKRERIRRTNRIFASLPVPERQALEELLG